MEKPLENQNVNDDVIETDEDTPDEYTPENSGLDPDSLIQKDIDIRKTVFSVFDFKRRCEQEKIIVDPEFQKNPNIWTVEQKSKFIESIILNFPLPYWYVKQTKKGKYIGFAE